MKHSSANIFQKILNNKTWMSKNLNIIAQNNGKNIFLFCILQRELHVYSSFEENSRNRYLFCQKAIAAPSIVKMKHYNSRSI